MENVSEVWYDEIIIDHLIPNVEDVVEMWYHEVAVKSNDDLLRRHMIIHIIHDLCL